MLAERSWVGWFYRLGGRQVGPVPRNKIATLVAGGQMRRGEPVWKAWNEGDEYRLVQTKAEVPGYGPSSVGNSWNAGTE